ncbi:c-type cytochrome [Telluribacter sp.]|jgi:mono/diheme cytochrome c family protein|uniref:c-type cytochrome n=1 Tax=Telluribacter sp. TaxID=1978767 RepID=UPI002E1131AD|nr:c-type cytochrome [Telluribacter sp.]
MRNYLKLICLFLLILVWAVAVAGCAARKSEPVKGEYFKPTQASIVNGEKVFMANCQKCHPGGEAGLGPSLNANPAPQFIKRFQMRHGLGVMPGFKPAEISKSDLRDISRYRRAWKHY